MLIYNVPIYKIQTIIIIFAYSIVFLDDEAKYPCDVQLDLENKSISNGHVGMNGHIHHGLSEYIPTITSQLDEKVYI